MNNNQVLPTIAELASKTKVANSQVCLRIKESTKDFFEKQAENYLAKSGDDAGNSKVSANSLMVTLLDSYAESYAQQMMTLQSNIEKMREYLHRQAHIIARSSNERLLFRIFKKNTIIDQNIDGESPNSLCASYHKMESGENYGIPQYSIFGTLGEEIYCTMDNEAGTGFCEEYDEDPSAATGRELHVPFRKWPVVVAMFDAYARKRQELDPNGYAELTLDAMKELADLINSTDDREDLALKLASFLVDYMEQTNA